MLRNAYLGAKIGVDTAENGPIGKDQQISVSFLSQYRSSSLAAVLVYSSLRGGRSKRKLRDATALSKLNRWRLLKSKTIKTLEGSFSSVSRPIFASKYAFCSIFRDLQDLQTFAPLQIQNFN